MNTLRAKLSPEYVRPISLDSLAHEHINGVPDLKWSLAVHCVRIKRGFKAH